MHYWNNGPGNAKDRKRFAQLDEAQKNDANEMAKSLYDGTRTVARCWKEAIDRVSFGEVNTRVASGPALRVTDKQLQAAFLAARAHGKILSDEVLRDIILAAGQNR